MGYLAEVLADSPGAAWTNLAVLTDDTGHGNLLGVTGSVPTTGSLIATEPTWSARSYSKNAANYLSATDSATLDLGDTFSMECWFQITALPGAAEFPLIFDKGTAAYELGLRGDNDHIFGNKNGTGTFVESSVVFAINTTYHLVVTKTGNSIFVYLNGVDRTGTITTGIVCANSAVDLKVGQDTAGSGPFDGVLAAPAVYPTVLSGARVLAHYQAGAGVSSSAAILPTWPRVRFNG